MTAYLANNLIGVANQAGYPARANTSSFQMQIDVDLANVPALTAVVAGGQMVGVAVPTAVLVAADTVDISNLPAGCAIKGAFLNTVEGMTGTTANSPTAKLDVVTAAKNLIALTPIGTAGAVVGNTGTAFVAGTDTTAVRPPVILTADDKLRLSFGGTLATKAPFGKLRITLDLLRL